MAIHVQKLGDGRLMISGSMFDDYAQVEQWPCNPPSEIRKYAGPDASEDFLRAAEQAALFALRDNELF